MSAAPAAKDGCGRPSTRPPSLPRTTSPGVGAGAARSARTPGRLRLQQPGAGRRPQLNPTIKNGAPPRATFQKGRFQPPRIASPNPLFSPQAFSSPRRPKSVPIQQDRRTRGPADPSTAAAINCPTRTPLTSRPVSSGRPRYNRSRNARPQPGPPTIPGEISEGPSPGRPKQITRSAADRRPAISTGATATALASSLYGALDYGIAFAASGLFLNALPPTIVWAAMKRVR